LIDRPKQIERMKHTGQLHLKTSIDKRVSSRRFVLSLVLMRWCLQTADDKFILLVLIHSRSYMEKSCFVFVELSHFSSQIRSTREAISRSQKFFDHGESMPRHTSSWTIDSRHTKIFHCTRKVILDNRYNE
jgi:hypothetical protein